MHEQEWDQVATTFEEEIFNVPANDHKGLITEAVERFASRDAVATDLGCGVGRTLPLLAGHFGRVYAVDVSSACLAVAEEACGTHANIRYVHADLSKDRKGYPQGDLVLCINTWLNADAAMRAGIVRNTCQSVKRGGHLVLVVPALGSALLSTLRQVQLNQRMGMDPAKAERKALPEGTGWAHGIVPIDGVPTKHFMAEELEALLAERGFVVEVVEKLEYGWDTEFIDPPAWMSAPYPWDWFLVARRVR